jgi:hypothetical protein
MKRAMFVSLLALLFVTGRAGSAVADEQRTTTSAASMISTSSSSLEESENNMILLGIYPSGPIASLTVEVEADAYGFPESAPCIYFGPGSPRDDFWYGETTVTFDELPGGELIQSQALLLCSFFTHHGNGPLSAEDFSVGTFEAKNNAGKSVSASLCVLDFDTEFLAEPGVDDCRYACGDAHCDGALTAVDALTVLRGAVGIVPCKAWLCDVDRDGTVASTDGLKVLRAAVGLKQSLLCMRPRTCLGRNF